MKFNAREEWSKLNAEQQARIGELALLLHVSQEAQQLVIDQPPDEICRRWEHAESTVYAVMQLVVPMDADLYSDGPDLAALDIQVCRGCGCTNASGCSEGCEWVQNDLCSVCAMQRTAHHHPDGVHLGPCCICEGTESVNNVIMLSRRSAVPGTGWGCVVCSLPMDGAYAVLCDDCLQIWQIDNSNLLFAIKGYPASGERVPIAELPEGEFDHDMAVDHG